MYYNIKKMFVVIYLIMIWMLSLILMFKAFYRSFEYGCAINESILYIENYIKHILFGRRVYKFTLLPFKNEGLVGWGYGYLIYYCLFPIVIILKEQRVNGSWCMEFMHLRYTLMGFERNYQIKILSKKIIHKRHYSTVGTSKLSLKNKAGCSARVVVSSDSEEIIAYSWVITGFTDGEGCFGLRIRKKSKSSSKWYCEVRFIISLHKKDLVILQQIQEHFCGIGNIVKHGKESIQYVITSIENLTSVVIPHFDKYNLITQKQADYLLFKMAVDLIKNKKHLTPEGLEHIVAIKASLNKGLSDELKTGFPNLTVDVSRPLIVNQTIPNSCWIVGFTAGEGCFLVKISKSSGSILGVGVQLVFQITQHSRDEQLIKSLILYLGCGRLVKDPNLSKVNFLVTRFSDILEKIIPFFNSHKHLIEGEKSKDFKDWCKVADIMKTKKHLTKEGLNQVIEIKAGMNRGRSY